jgi:hypothetical protein
LSSGAAGRYTGVSRGQETGICEVKDEILYGWSPTRTLSFGKQSLFAKAVSACSLILVD